MTRLFHHPVRLVPRCRPRPPRAHTLSFTSFRLVAVVDPEPGQPALAAIELSDPSNAMRVFRMTPRAPEGPRIAGPCAPRAYQVKSSHPRSRVRIPSANSSAR